MTWQGPIALYQCTVRWGVPTVDPGDRLAIFPDLGRFSKPWALANKTRLVAGIGALLLPLFVSIVFQGLSNMG